MQGPLHAISEPCKIGCLSCAIDSTSQFLLDLSTLLEQNPSFGGDFDGNDVVRAELKERARRSPNPPG